MSVFVCNNTHITALAAYAARNRFLGYQPEDIRKIGSILLAENVKSVNYRYKDNDASTFVICPWAEYHPFAPIEILKAAACLEYQSCEHPGWEKSRACSIVQTARNTAVAELAEWNATAWEIQTPPNYKAPA